MAPVLEPRNLHCKCSIKSDAGRPQTALRETLLVSGLCVSAGPQSQTVGIQTIGPLIPISVALDMLWDLTETQFYYVWKCNNNTAEAIYYIGSGKRLA